MTDGLYINPIALLELLREMFGGPRNVQPLYNGWLIWRGSHCTFCSRDEIDTMMNQQPQAD